MHRLFWGFLFIICNSCSSLNQTPPTLELRSLELTNEVPGFVYQWNECLKKGLFGNCRQWQIKKELYDLRDPVILKQLMDMGFVATVRRKPLP